jgi:hypothetical protein
MRYRDLHNQLDGFAIALLAQHFDTQSERPEIELVTRIRRERSAMTKVRVGACG